MIKKCRPPNAAAVFTMLLTAAMTTPLVSTGAVETEYLYLSGRGSDDAIEWDFLCTEGRKSGTWTKIPVPSQWEQHGFGSYNYGLDEEKSKEVGKYKRQFTIPIEWKRKRIKVVFDGAMTDTEVLINGKPAGPVHQGGFYRFDYDITDLVKEGNNLLEVNVRKVSANKSLEIGEREADYWIFGGIFRPVWLEVLPQEYIDWTSVNAEADGTFELDVYLKDLDKADQVVAQIFDSNGDKAGDSFFAATTKEVGKVRLSTTVDTPALWSAETPTLYGITIDLVRDKSPIHRVTKRFGFRTFEVREGEGLFLNGQRIHLKGVNRHSFWPESGRCLNRELNYADARLIKEMNMNAIRCAHYAPDVDFLDACDELGLYVLNELCTWQDPPLDTPTAKRLIGQLVKRDQMHPSILFWNNGNEDGWNTEADGEFAKYDLQNRIVLHPHGTFGGINTDHYEAYESVQEILTKGDLYMPTEFLHGLYDGGHGAGLNDYWKLLKGNILGTGGFLWVFSDEGVARTDRNGAIDTDGNHAPDGILGPYREKEGSFYTIKEIWSPVQIHTSELTADFDGAIDIENHYDFRNLDSCTFTWDIVTFPPMTEREAAHRTIGQGTLRGPSVAPGKRGKLRLNLPEGWNKGDVLNLTAYNSEKGEIFTWRWSIQPSSVHLQRIVSERASSQLQIEEDGDILRVSADDFVAVFDRKTGLLQGLRKGKKKLPLTNGPRVVHLQKTNPEKPSPEIELLEREDSIVINIINPGDGIEELSWTIHNRGYLEMNCSYLCDGEYDFHGVAFDFPESQVAAKRWLGNGPYRVWKNRMKGPQFGIWDSAYNSTVPGMSWEYPAFKGYFSNLYWLELMTMEGTLGVVTDQSGLFMRLFDPEDGAAPRNTKLPTFKGDLSFLHAIPAIGTKFKQSHQLGPESQNTTSSGIFDVSLFFLFETEN